MKAPSTKGSAPGGLQRSQSTLSKTGKRLFTRQMSMPARGSPKREPLDAPAPDKQPPPAAPPAAVAKVIGEGHRSQRRRRGRRQGVEAVEAVGPARKVLVEVVTVEYRSYFLKQMVKNNTLPVALREAAKAGLTVWEVYNPPDELYSGSATTHSQMQLFMVEGLVKGPNQFHVQDVSINQQAVRVEPTDPNAKPLERFVIDHSQVTDALEKAALQHYSFAGVHIPPVQDMLRPSVAHVQLVFQRPYLRPEVLLTYKHLIVELHCKLEQGGTNIVDMKPTISDLGNQGYRLVGTLNPPCSRQQQLEGKPSTVLLVFEKPEQEAATRRYISDVVKTQVTRTNVSFGVKVQGQYVKMVREKAQLGWELCAIMDVPEHDHPGLTLFLAFQAPVESDLSPSGPPRRSLSSRSGKRGSLLSERSQSFRDPGILPSPRKPSRSQSFREPRAAPGSPLRRQLSALSAASASSALSSVSALSLRSGASEGLRDDTSARLFRRANGVPVPEFIYAHDFEDEDTRKGRRRRKKSKCCGCVVC